MIPEQQHWMTSENSGDWRPDREPYGARFESIGLALPSERLTSQELVGSLRHHPHIDLERLTGIHERRVAGPGEDSLSLAVRAARDCLDHSGYDGGDLDMVLSCSISKYRSGFRQRYEAPLSLFELHAAGRTKVDLHVQKLDETNEAIEDALPPRVPACNVFAL